MRATRFSRGTLGVAGVLCLGLSGLGATALAAPDGPGNIDFDQKGAISIHKHEKSANPTSGDVTGGGAGAAGKPIPNVTFTAYKLSANLRENGDWEKLAALQVGSDACGPDFKSPNANLGDFTVATQDASHKATTIDDGTASIDNLEVGAYLVCETEAPANVSEKAAPFVATVPFPNTAGNIGKGASDPSNGEWIYTVNVYPKNVLIEKPAKDVVVDGNGLKNAGKVEFPITAKVPAVSAGNSFRHFMISDPMPEGYSDPAVKNAEVLLDNAPVDPTWFTITKNGDREINVSFSKVGLTELAKPQNAGKTVKVTFTATVTKAASPLENIANLYVDTMPGNEPPQVPPTTPPGNPVPSNKVLTAWGAATIFKKSAENNLGLEGAEFQIYNAKDPYPANGQCTKEIATDNDQTTTVDETQPIVIDGKSTFSSNGDGKILVEGLFVDKVVGAGDANIAVQHQSRCYVVVETKAPEGFVLPTNGDQITALKVNAGGTAADQIDIVNTKTTVPQLPLTGAAGKILMTVGGLSLMAIAVGFVLAARKRRVNEA